MTPGDVLTCAACGTSAVAYSTAPSMWSPGAAVLVSWHGYRHEALQGAAPDLCLLCRVADFPRPAPSRRVSILDDLARNGCRVVGAEWNSDTLLEDAYQRWISGGSRPLAQVSVSPLDFVVLVPVDRPVKAGDPVYTQGRLF